MKLQKQTTRKIGNVEYAKWVITIPPSQIEKIGWKEGDNLESVVKGKSLIVKQMASLPKKPEKMTYEEFKKIVKEEIEKVPKGLTWTEIKTRRSEFHQKVPNNLWVRMLESDIGLIRKKRLDGKTVWRLEHA